MTKFIKANINEIKNSYSLRFFSLFITFIYIGLSVLWMKQAPSYSFESHFCTLFTGPCSHLIAVTASLFDISVIFILVLSLLTFISFALIRFCTFHWFILLFNTIVVFLLYSSMTDLSDFSFFFLIVTSFVFLLIPNKLPTLKWLIVLFYIQSSFLNINPYWMSGLGLIGLKNIASVAKTAEWIAVLHVIWFALVPLGLLLNKNKIFYSSIFALIISHIVLYQIGYFANSIIFLGLLSLFALDRVEQHLKKVSFQTFHFSSPNNLWTPGFLVLYMIVQFSSMIFGPHLKTALTLAPSQELLTCSIGAFMKNEKQIEEYKVVTDGLCDKDKLFSQLKMKCDQVSESHLIVYFNGQHHSMKKEKAHLVQQTTNNFCDPAITPSENKDHLWTQKTAQ
ncbi:MAG: hypothetical protein KDD50_14295 [Bdellovibrionales bacterium]|nr:hypothetical protein [Bdellovibrionales bacterium]